MSQGLGKGTNAEIRNKNAGPEFEDPARSGCHRCQRPLQTSRLPAGETLHYSCGLVQSEFFNYMIFKCLFIVFFGYE